MVSLTATVQQLSWILLILLLVMKCTKCDNIPNGDSTDSQSGDTKDNQNIHSQQNAEIEDTVTVGKSGSKGIPNVPDKLNNGNKENHETNLHKQAQVDPSVDKSEHPSSSSQHGNVEFVHGSHPNVESESNDKESQSILNSPADVDTTSKTEGTAKQSSGSSDSEDVLVFAEKGPDDESLVDQMLRLSEKIKKNKGKNELKHNDGTQHNIANLDGIVEEFEEMEKKIMEFVETSPDKGNVPDGISQDEGSHPDHIKSDVVDSYENDKNPNVKTSDAKSDQHQNELKKTDTMVKHSNEDKQQQQAEESTVIRHLEMPEENLDNMIQNIGRKFGHIAKASVNNEKHDDDDDFPDDEGTFDSNGKSKDSFLSASSNVDIQNTQPPSSNIEPSKTEMDNKVIKSSTNAQDLMADKTVISATPTLEVDKPSRVESVATTDKEKDITPPSKKIEKASGHTMVSEEMKTASVEKDVAASKNLQSSENVMDIITVTQTQTLGIPSSENLLLSETIRPEAHVRQSETQGRFSATQKQSDMASKAMETSDKVSEGTVQKTEVKNQAPSSIGTEKDNKEIHEKTESSKAEDNAVPSMSKSVPQEQPSPPPSLESSSQQQQQQQEVVTEEKVETEEEKQEKAQAHHYFEEGEKLVNNSYKKDFIQAYEYFELAASKGHIKAREYVGFGHLLGDYIDLNPEKALNIFQDLSNKGSPKGQLGLGFSYSSGLAVNSSQAKALIYFTFAALGGEALGQMVLGYRYLSGIGVESKCETALQYYRKVATTVAETTTAGSPMVQRIRLHEQAENKDTGSSLMDEDLLQYYQFLADKGDLQAQVVLGQLYYQGGRGVPINHERAQHYFLMASESGNANALAFLGKMHSEGSPAVKQDNATALQYFKKAADKGNPIGLCGMGMMYMYGKGVDKDYPKALQYFTKSSDQGWSDGQLHLGIMHFSGKGVRRDYKMAVKYFNLASQGGHVLAFYHLAQMHATGTGVLRNCHTAVEFYKNVAERGSWSSMLMEAHQLYKEWKINEALLKYTFLAELGYEVAQTNVAYILDQGESSLFTEKETYQRALLHWTRAASQGSTVARLKMGDYHYYGYGTEIDYESAASHYRLATETQRNAQAMYNLGYMHENGLGLKQDVHLAKRFYDMAAETSGEAYIPVTLALLKLGMFYGVDVFNKELEDYYSIFNKMDIRFTLGPNWDIYLATFLAIGLGIIIVLRRQR